MWARICQSCGHIQKDTKPKEDGKMTEAYRARTCKKCRSEDFDYGSNGFIQLPNGKLGYAPVVIYTEDME